MIIGTCGAWDEGSLRKIRDHGCGCVEPPLFLVAKDSDEKLKRSREVCEEIGLKCLTFNGMLTGEMMLLGGRPCYGPLEEYLDKALAKASILGGNIIVLGCGHQRTRPEGMDVETATGRFCDILRDVVLPVAKSRGFTVAREELRKEECNFINSAKEAYEIVKTIGDGSLKLHIDYFHTMLGGATLEEIASYGDAIAHVHLSSLKHFREFPKKDDVEEFIGLRKALEKAGYSGAATFEGVMPGDYWETLKEAVETMRAAGY